MKCDLCHGKGTHNRDLNCRHSNVTAFEYGCRLQVTCKRCEGVGYLGLDLIRIQDFLASMQSNHFLNSGLRKEIQAYLRKKKTDFKHLINLLEVIHTHLNYYRETGESKEARMLLRKFN